jgi:DNA-directed RNA polymerase subunit F
MEILDEKQISMLEAKQILEQRKKTGDLVYEQKITLEFLEKVVKISPAKLKTLKEELDKIQILKPRHIALIANILPDTLDEVQMLFSKERTNLKKDEVQQIVDAVKKIK